MAGQASPYYLRPESRQRQTECRQVRPAQADPHTAGEDDRQTDSATTGQYSAGMGGNWPDSAVTSNHSARQGSDSPGGNAVGVPHALNLRQRRNVDLKTETNE